MLDSHLAGQHMLAWLILKSGLWCSWFLRNEACWIKIECNWERKKTKKTQTNQPTKQNKQNPQPNQPTKQTKPSKQNKQKKPSSSYNSQQAGKIRQTLAVKKVKFCTGGWIIPCGNTGWALLASAKTFCPYDPRNSFPKENYSINLYNSKNLKKCTVSQRGWGEEPL